jgi:hypothetical protein
LQISPDGENYTTLLQFELQAGTPKTVSLDNGQAGFYRVILPLGGAYRIEPASIAWLRSGGQQSPWLVPVDDVRLLQQGEAPGRPTKPEVQSRSAINLTGEVDPSGRLSWSVPDGNWALFRFGQTIYDGGGWDGWQKLTKWPSPGAQRFEIDMMSAEALDQQLAETADKVASDIGPLAGKTLKYLHIDSWECGDPNWTTHMVEEFTRQRGYDPKPYLGALTGTIVDSPEVTDRFLRDLRRTVADLWGDFYGHFLARSRGLGMGVHAESGEWGPFSIMDSFMNFGLSANGVLPDFTCEGSQLDFIHRSLQKTTKSEPRGPNSTTSSTTAWRSRGACGSPGPRYHPWAGRRPHRRPECPRAQPSMAAPSFNIVSGWDCGGTWVTPEHATKRLTWSKTLVQGPREFSRELPQPDSTDGYYKDVAVVAFPLPETSLLAMDKAEATFTGSDCQQAVSGAAIPEPFAAASLYIVPNRFCMSKGNELQVSEDGET